MGCPTRNPEQYMSDSVGVVAKPAVCGWVGLTLDRCADALVTANIASRINRTPVFFIVPPMSHHNALAAAMGYDD